MAESSRIFLNFAPAHFRTKLPQGQPASAIQSYKTRFVKKRAKCSEKCRRHLFSIRKIGNGKEKVKFSIEKFGIEHRFCPKENKFMGEDEGGMPSFNPDRRIDTPSFILTSQKTEDKDRYPKIKSWQFQQDLAKATNSTAQTSRPLYLKKNKPFKQIKDESLPIIIQQFMSVLRSKDREKEKEKGRDKQLA